jgi:MFS family permease
MTFRLFIYYCAIAGGWAAFLAWLLVYLMGPGRPDTSVTALTKTTVIAGALGMLVAAALGFIDALLNATGSQRLMRVLVCAAVGLPGGLLGGLIGESLHKAGMPLLFGWMLVGIFVGASIGIFDILRAQTAGGELRMPLKKTLNGVYGGLLGGLIGGAPFGLLLSVQSLPMSGLAIGLVLLGLCVGLLIGLAQVFLKEAWLRVEQGRRSGRQMMLSKEETTIGRAEGVDLGLYGEQGIEKLHARIILKGNRYYLDDVETPGGTFLNDARVVKPTPLKNGDAIRLGSCVLRFGERQK